MRRTFNDLARRADVESIVKRSISGHLTERMQDHYSTVDPNEQPQSIARVIDLFGGAAHTPNRQPETEETVGGAPALSGGAPKEEAG